jgi:hypothetical protein
VAQWLQGALDRMRRTLLQFRKHELAIDGFSLCGMSVALKFMGFFETIKFRYRSAHQQTVQ